MIKTADVTPNRPRSGKLRAAMEYSGIGRSSLYILASRHPLLFRKLGASIIVDFDELDRIIETLPSARIKTPATRVPGFAGSQPAA